MRTLQLILPAVMACLASSALLRHNSPDIARAAEAAEAVKAVGIGRAIEALETAEAALHALMNVQLDCKQNQVLCSATKECCGDCCQYAFAEAPEKPGDPLKEFGYCTKKVAEEYCI